MMTAKFSALLLIAGTVLSVPANAQDPSGSKVCIINNGGFVMRAATRCQKSGEGMVQSNGTGHFPLGSSRCINLKTDFNPPVKDGASCWMFIDIDLGVARQSGENYTFDTNSANTVTYEVSGGGQNPRFHRY
ncbi:MAG: hypothetical protein WDO17_23180 [Alphaproteobacteria bacterium]